MKIISATGGIASTNCFVIADEVAKQAVLFDAPDHTVEPALDEVQKQGWDLIGLWLTHGHFDHLADHEVVRSRFPNAKLLMNKLDEPKLLTPGSRVFPLPFEIPPGKADGFITDGQELAIGSLTTKVIFTPGHSPGHVCFYFEKEKVLVGGDLIIGGAIGRTDLPDSDEKAMGNSLRRVMALPDNVTLLTGHGEVSTIGQERENNPYVQMALRGEL